MAVYSAQSWPPIMVASIVMKSYCKVGRIHVSQTSRSKENFNSTSLNEASVTSCTFAALQLPAKTPRNRFRSHLLASRIRFHALPIPLNIRPKAILALAVPAIINYLLSCRALGSRL
ncbi:hypothetical protein CY34DRAFT_368425 [Suillus luteus UH-Slu-Lm8-n1]|uniref:Uncharacterized protein n=1 Tax=Suillus luteus UH-Slu-Lm8-n1 TaxID=930992 RepID=A0A0D0BLA5_9AGAM|nr:hypothetical protein CY34DRAFT_368425 [Suillus luteus UH-Slu-Lm8-n1]